MRRRSVFGRPWVVGLGVMVCVGSFGSSGSGQIGSFRITEVDPRSDQVEVTNTGGDHTTTQARPFCHRFTYGSTIPAGLLFLSGEARVFQVAGLANDSDLWLYRSSPFTIGGNLIHGVKFGSAPNVGRASLASGVGLWSGSRSFAPTPPVGTSLAWDGFGFHPADWYVDATPTFGSADSTSPGTVPSRLMFPFSEQGFEGVLLGDEVFAVQGWSKIDESASGVFTVRVVNDVAGRRGDVGPDEDSTRWLRIRDQEAGDLQNRFYSSTVVSPEETNYAWVFDVNLEDTPPGGSDVKPRFTVQHLDGSFADAWGIEFSSAGADLVVTGTGGTPAATPLYPLSSPTGVGDWVRIKIAVDFQAGVVRGSVNGVEAGSLPIDLSQTADPTQLRFCYRGEGAGNVATMLLDRLAVQFEGLHVGVETSSTQASIAGMDAVDVSVEVLNDQPSGRVVDAYLFLQQPDGGLVSWLRKTGVSVSPALSTSRVFMLGTAGQAALTEEGSYLFGARLVDSITGETLSFDTVGFSIVP